MQVNVGPGPAVCYHEKKHKNTRRLGARIVGINPGGSLVALESLRKARQQLTGLEFVQSSAEGVEHL
jgi:hypothetical protein